MEKINILAIAGVVLGALLGALLPKLREYVKKTDTKIDDIALDVVVYVNDMFNGSSNESKKQRAKDLITLELAKDGVKKVSDNVLDKAVEMAVTKVKVSDKENETLENVGKPQA